MGAQQLVKAASNAVLPFKEGLLAVVVSVLCAAMLQRAGIGAAADPSYYGTIAQVLPVFLLAAVVETNSHFARLFASLRSAMLREIEAAESEERWVGATEAAAMREELSRTAGSSASP